MILPPWKFKPKSVVLHKKSGKIYTVMAKVKVEKTLQDAYAYYRYDNDGTEPIVWIRPKDEMEDGRFTLLGDEE